MRSRFATGTVLIGAMIPGMASAQSLGSFGVRGAEPFGGRGANLVEAPVPTWYGYASSGQRDTWRTVALVSGIVLIFGLVDDDPTLTILGGVGVLFSLYESGQFGYRLQNRHGFDLVHSGPLSFGVTPLGHAGYSHENENPRPAAYVQWTIKM